MRQVLLTVKYVPSQGCSSRNQRKSGRFEESVLPEETPALVAFSLFHHLLTKFIKKRKCKHEIER